MIIFKDFVLDIYKEGGITAAANKLYMSQPALSTSLKRLEADLGVTLFNRATAPIQLTKEGELYIEALNQMSILTKNLQLKFDDIKNLKSGNLSVGAAHFVTSFFLLGTISKFSEIYPGISVNAVESNSSSLKEKLLNGDLDIVVDYDFDATYFESYPILTEKIFLCVPKHFSVNKKLSQYYMRRNEIISGGNVPYINPNDLIKCLQNEKFILMREGNNMGKYSANILESAEVIPNVLLKTDQLVTAFEASVSGLGVTFITDRIAKAIDDKDNLFYYGIDGENGYRTLYFATNKNMYTSKAAKAFIDFTINRNKQ